MESPSRKGAPTAEVLFRDGFGDRVLFRDAQGRAAQESLILTSDLSAVRTFEFSLSQRLVELESFDHPSFVRIRKVVHLGGPSPRLSIASDYSGGHRLSAILAAMEQKGTTHPVDAALRPIRQILEAMAAFHRHGSEITHGALGPERVLLVDGNVRIADYILGPAVEQLRLSSDRYWKDLRVAVAPVPGAIHFDARVDVAQVALVALSLFSSRLLREDQALANLDESRLPSVPRPLRSWLARALQIEQRQGLFTMSDALYAFDEAVAELQKAPSPRAPIVKRAIRPAPPPVPRDKPKPVAPRAQLPVEPRTGTMYQPAVGVAQAPRRDRRERSRLKTLVTIGGLIAVVAGAFAAAQYVPPPALFSREGTLGVESNPTGAQLFVDGQPVGETPLTVSLKRGQHEIELRIGERSRAFNVAIVAGTHVSQYVEMFPGKK
jgi:hypothetical protein